MFLSRFLLPELLAQSSISGQQLPGGRVDLEVTKSESTTQKIIRDRALFLKRVRDAEFAVSVLFP
jgi:hypothetical protein